MVHSISNRMSQRILDRLQQALIQPRLLPKELNPHLAPASPRQIPHHPRKLPKQMSHRLHPRLHHALAQIRSHTIQPPRQLRKIRSIHIALQHLVPSQHQLTNQIHHPVQHLDIDAQSLLTGSRTHRRSRGFHRHHPRSSHRNIRANRRSSPSIQGSQQSNQFAIFIANPSPLATRLFNQHQNLAQPIQQTQQPTDQLRSHRQLPIAQRAQQMLSRMSQLLQPVKPQKPRRPLDRMHRAEDLSHQLLAIARPYLKLSQAPFHPVQPFLALRNKLFSQVVHTPLIGQSTLSH